MADPQNNLQLAHETAEALLTAIKAEAPSAASRSSDGLRSLAEAYALVREAMPKPPGRVRVG